MQHSTVIFGTGYRQGEPDDQVHWLSAMGWGSGAPKHGRGASELTAEIRLSDLWGVGIFRPTPGYWRSKRCLGMREDINLNGNLAWVLGNLNAQMQEVTPQSLAEITCCVTFS